MALLTYHYSNRYYDHKIEQQIWEICDLEVLLFKKDYIVIFQKGDLAFSCGNQYTDRQSIKKTKSSIYVVIFSFITLVVFFCIVLKDGMSQS